MARKHVEKRVLEIISELDPSGTNTEIYRKKFSIINDKEFKIMVDRIASGDTSWRLFVPNGDSKVKLNFSRNIKIARTMGFDIYQKLTITKDGFTYTPNIKFPILFLPVRRASQHILKNFSVHKNRKTRNRLTGQVAGGSASGRLTLQEVQILQPLGLKNTLKEFVGIRGGDIGASNALNGLLFRNGSISKRELSPYITKTGSSRTLAAYFKAMHIDLKI